MLGKGTLNSPYRIFDANDLQAMENNPSAYYELGGDIDASATSGWNSGAGFLPIGQTVTGFTGQLDGKDYFISGLFINRPAMDMVGLFRFAEGATIRNVHLTSVDITGNDYVGALVGYAYTNTTIDSCSSAGSVSGDIYIGGLAGYVEDATIISDSYSSCTVTGLRTSGGFVGYCEGTVFINCYATGSVDVTDATGAGAQGGGFAGYIGAALAGSTISQCYATGNVTTEVLLGNGKIGGGFAGYVNGSDIDDCYARGDVTATVAGGFLGQGGPAASTVDNCYSTGFLTGLQIGGFCAIMGAAIITNCFWDIDTAGTGISAGGLGRTTAQMKTQATFTGAGWDFVTIWYMSSLINDGYPSLLSTLMPNVRTDPATEIT